MQGQTDGSLLEAEEPQAHATRDALKKAQTGRKITEDEAQDALEWFLEAEDAAQVEEKPLRLNMGTKDKPQWVRWVVAPVEDSLINKLREGSKKGTRAQRRRGDAEVDEMLVARKMVAAGTLEPDVAALAKKLELVDPADAVYRFFQKAKKTGLITQLSGEILSISGWDDEDIQEVEAARG